MNLDKGIINHWANLFESEEAKANGTYVTEKIGPEQIDEATLQGFKKEDFEEIVKSINQELKSKRLESWSATLLGSGEDFTIVLDDSNSEPPHFDTEYYSADGAYDEWYEVKSYERERVMKIVFNEIDREIKNASENFQFVNTYVDDEESGESHTMYKMVPKAKAKKLVDDAVRNLIDKEYNMMRKLPQEKREKFFRDHSWPRFALMAANNGQYISNRTDNISAPYSIDGFGRMLMDMAEKIGAYTREDFQNLVGKDELETGFDMDGNEKKKERDQRGEFDSATWNIRESEDGNGKEIIDTFTNILNCGLPKPELKKMLASLETLKGKEDMINQAELERLITMYKSELGGDVGEEEMVGEVMSPAEIMASWNKNHADDEKKAAEEKAKKDAETQARGIKRITITEVGSDGTIKYTIVKNDGTEREEVSKGIGTDDEEFKRTKRMLRTMSGKTPDDLDVFVAMLRRAFDSASKTPIQWYYHFDRGDEGRLDDDWYYRPSEDYFGYTPDFVQSIFDAGGRVGGMI